VLGHWLIRTLAGTARTARMGGTQHAIGCSFAELTSTGLQQNTWLLTEMRRSNSPKVYLSKQGHRLCVRVFIII